MKTENQESRKTTHVRVFPDKKKRVEKIVATMTLKDNKMYEVDLIDQILSKALPKLEKKLGIQSNN